MKAEEIKECFSRMVDDHTDSKGNITPSEVAFALYSAIAVEATNREEEK